MDERNFSIKEIWDVAPLRDILEKHLDFVKGSTIDGSRDDESLWDFFERVQVKKEIEDEIVKEFAAFWENAKKVMEQEAREFDPDVDLSDDHYLWGSDSNKEKCVRSIETRYKGMTGNIIFYGPSNITFWYSLEKDMLPFKAQNHGMGGCTDEDLIHYAPRLLYPFNPKVVFFQSGSNDLASGISLDQIFERKKNMYAAFLEYLPSAELVIMSGLPLPGRIKFWDDTVKINNYLKELSEMSGRLHYMDATDVMLKDRGEDERKTSDGRYFIPEYFRMDQIHLNVAGHRVWTKCMKEELRKIGIAK